MSQEYTPVTWVDEEEGTPGTLINKARLDQMQTAHHYADGFEEVDTIPTADPGVDYHKIVYCTVDKQFYRWTGSAWEKDIDDDTKALLLAHEADHANPHVVTKAQVGLGNCDNTSDADKPVSTAQQTALDAKVDDTQIVSAWQTTPDDTHIPSEKLVKDGLDAKVDDTQVVSSWQSTTDNDHIPTEKLTKDTIDGVDASAVHKAGEETITGAKTIKGDINIGEVGTPTDVTQVGDLSIKGNITIEGNITQNGSAYETHAEKIYTTKDYIHLREGATGALSPGDYTGMEAEKYDGTNNGRLVFDSSGTARVGDVGDEEPLLTRDESADMTDGALLRWDAAGSKAVSNNVTFCRKYSGSASVATSSWAASGITAYPYKADISVTGITANDYPTVAFAQAEAASGNYSPECDTSAGTLTIYAKAVPSGAITITYMIIQDVS